MPAFLRRLFRRSGNVEKQAATLTTRDLIAHALYGSRTILPSQAFEIYRQSSALATAIDLIARKIEAIDPVVEVDGEILPEHPAVDFLMKPNDRFMWRSLIGDLTRQYLLNGNGYLIGIGNVNRPPLEIYTGHPLEVNPIHQMTDAFPDRYSFTGKIAPGIYIREPRPGGGIRFVASPLQELYHVIGYTTRADKGIGDSPVESIILEIRQHIAGREHNESMLRQGGRMSLLFLIKDWLPREQFNDLLGRLRDQFGGAENAGILAGQRGAPVTLDGGRGEVVTLLGGSNVVIRLNGGV